MKKSLYLSLFLGVISVLAAVILSLTNTLTESTIKQSNIDKQNRQLSAIFTQKTKFTEEKLDGSFKTIEAIYKAEENNKVLGYVYRVKTKGYAGKIRYFVAVNPNGKYITFNSIEHGETPGFGTKMDEKPFKNQFTEKTISDDIDGLSGATITTNGLFKGLDEVVEHFEKNYKK